MNFRKSIKLQARPGSIIKTNPERVPFFKGKIGTLEYLDRTAKPHPMWKISWDEEWTGWLKRSDFEVIKE